MSTKAIYEAAGKQLLNKYLGSTAAECRCVNVDGDTKWDELIGNNRWLETEVCRNSDARSNGGCLRMILPLF